MTPDDVRQILGHQPSRTALLFDFDGSLAPIVTDPAAAVAVTGARGLLERLGERFARVGIVSGRPLDFLVDHVGSTVALSGLYGIESRIDGVVTEHPDAPAWRAVVRDVVSDGGLPSGLTLEPKGVSLTVHYRSRPDLEPDAHRWGSATAASTGLQLRPAKASLELHPPIDASKASAVRILADACTTVSYVGDDVGDLPAFAALDEMAATGVTTVKIVCGGPELPGEVAAAADLLLPDPAAVVALFAPLAPESP